MERWKVIFWVSLLITCFLLTAYIESSNTYLNRGEKYISSQQTHQKEVTNHE